MAKSKRTTLDPVAYWSHHEQLANAHLEDIFSKIKKAY